MIKSVMWRNKMYRCKKNRAKQQNRRDEVNGQQTEIVTTWHRTDPVNSACLQYKSVNKKLSWSQKENAYLLREIFAALSRYS